MNFLLNNHVTLTVLLFISYCLYTNVYIKYFKTTTNSIDYGDKLVDTYVMIHRGEK